MSDWTTNNSMVAGSLQWVLQEAGSRKAGPGSRVQEGRSRKAGPGRLGPGSPVQEGQSRKAGSRKASPGRPVQEGQSRKAGKRWCHPLRQLWRSHGVPSALVASLSRFQEKEHRFHVHKGGISKSQSENFQDGRCGPFWKKYGLTWGLTRRPVMRLTGLEDPIH